MNWEESNACTPLKLREILANKLATLVGRSELKDVIDLYFLEKAGHDLLAALPDAQKKRAGWSRRCFP